MNAPPPAPRDHGPRRWLNVGLGLFFVGVAGLGVVLPVLPTTPFLILASACFVRSSPRLNHWLLHTRLFGPMLREWQEHRCVRRRVKVVAALVLIAVVALSVGLGRLSWPWLAVLIGLALVGLFVVLRLPEMPATRRVEEAIVADMAVDAELMAPMSAETGAANSPRDDRS